MNQTVWAKSSEKGAGNPVCLAEHIRDALAVFDKIKGRVNGRLCDLVRLTIVCHDWGKVLPAFQIRTLKNSTYRPDVPLIQMPHSLFSLLWIDETKLREKLQKELQEKDIHDYQEFVLAAIAYHHWRENFFELISGSHQEIIDLLNELEERKGAIETLQKNLQEEIRQISDDWQELIAFNEKMAKGLRNGVPFSEYARPPYQLYFLPKRIGIDEQKMRDWILIAGFLQRSDHFASFCEEEGEEVRTADPEICPVDLETTKEKAKEKVRSRLASADNIASLWQIDKINVYKDKSLILIAPTGYGKTEFAFLWGSGEKFFYTLPLRSAVNQIYERVKNLFGEGKAGLLHSDADVFLLGDGGEGQASMKIYDFARQLAFPAIISTGDQFFPYALRPPGYEKIYATFSYARLIIDEVQAYDPRAAAIVVKFIEHIVHMGGKFLLMTATLPEFVRAELREVLGSAFEEVNLYEEKKADFEAIRKHKIRVDLIENSTEEKKIDFSIPDEKLVEILKQANSGKRVLVIANTVKQTQDIFHKLKEKIEANSHYARLKDNLWLLHSRFTLKDREEREQTLAEKFSNPKPEGESEGRILVATQVVEASLDIDADVLFTEIAPLDALVQRMGRVLRRYGPMSSPNSIPEPKEPNVFVWVFQNELQSGRGYVYDSDLVLLTLKILKDKSEGQGNDNTNKDWIRQKKKKANRTDKLISAVLDELFGGKQSENRQKRGKSKGASSGSPAPSKNFELICSEYDKYDLVKKLYESLPEDSNYLAKFRQTKDILDAGYMSDRKEEAHEVFREIYDIQLIPQSRVSDFIEELKELFTKKSKCLFTLFKKQVLSKYVVSDSYFKHRKNLSPNDWVFYKVIEKLNENDIEKKLKRWLSGIFVLPVKYDNNLGVIDEKGKAGRNDNEENQETEGIIKDNIL
jgi:CRISPR-associated endonuclease/helicase Cas3